MTGSTAFNLLLFLYCETLQQKPITFEVETLI